MFPTSVVVDTTDGYTYWRDADGDLLTLTTARDMAARLNSTALDPERYAVFMLAADKVS
jgi:hypothetical protein